MAAIHVQSFRPVVTRTAVVCSSSRSVQRSSIATDERMLRVIMTAPMSLRSLGVVTDGARTAVVAPSPAERPPGREDA